MQKFSRASAQKSADLFAILSDPTRLLIVQLIEKRGGYNVSAIAKKLSMTQSAVSHQLRLLCDARIATSSKKGREVTYMLASSPAAARIAKLLRSLA